MRRTAEIFLLLLTITFGVCSPVFASTTYDVIDDAPLKKNGAKNLSVLIEDSAGDKPNIAWLQGVTAGKVIWKKPLTLTAPVNTAKTDVICRNRKIQIVSQFPGSAAYLAQTFSWDGSKLVFLSKKEGDPSQEQVDKLMKIAVSGTPAQLAAFADEEHVVFYPGNYVNLDNVTSMLRKGHKVAMSLASAHKPQLAAQRLKLCFDASVNLVYLEGGAGEKKRTPDRWIEAWSQDSISLPSSVWKPLLKDYARLLKECGRGSESAQILATFRTDS